MHKAAKGQDLGQSGRAGFSCGQGIPSDMDAMSSIAPAGAAAIASDGAAMGTIRRLATARIDSRRNRTGQSFTLVVSHMLRCNKRSGPFTLSRGRRGQRSWLPIAAYAPRASASPRPRMRSRKLANAIRQSIPQADVGRELAGAVTQRTVVLRRFHVSARGAVGSGKFLV